MSNHKLQGGEFLDNSVMLIDKIKSLPKNERKDYLKERYKFYRSCPEGILAYVTENIYFSSNGVCTPIHLWEIQKRLIYEISDFLFDKNREIYTLLGSRQCGKTYTMNLISDAMMTLFGNYNIVLLHADATRGGKNLLELKDIIANKDSIMKFKPKINRAMMYVAENNSKFIVIPTQKSSKSSDTGRSLTSAMLWVDEAAFIDLEKLEASLWPITSQAFLQCRKDSVPFGIIMSSSANGRIGVGKRFYEFWKMAESNSVDGIVSRGDVSGFRLHYSQIPDKDEKWVAQQRTKFSERKFNQEFDCVFYGGESTFFGDETIKAIQERLQYISNHPSPYHDDVFISSMGTKFDIQNYGLIEKDNSYIIGIDVSKGAGMDYHVLEIFDYYTMKQIMEIKNNQGSSSEFKDLVHYVVKYLVLGNGGRCAVAIENNLGYSLIAELFKEDEMYRSLIYRDTISEDNKSKRDTGMVPYGECKYGIATTTLTRPMIIDELYRFTSNNIENFNSNYLLSEIESLEMKDGKIEGAVHDDSIFALGMLLLLKSKGRVANINSIFDACEDFWPAELKKNSMEKRKATIQIDDYDLPDQPLVPPDMGLALGMMAGMKLNTATVLNFQSNFDAEKAHEISQFHKETLDQNMNLIKLGKNKMSSLGDHESRSKMEEKMKSSDETYTSNEIEKRYEEDWGKYVG